MYTAMEPWRGACRGYHVCSAPGTTWVYAVLLALHGCMQCKEHYIGVSARSPQDQGWILLKFPPICRVPRALSSIGLCSICGKIPPHMLLPCMRLLFLSSNLCPNRMPPPSHAPVPITCCPSHFYCSYGSSWCVFSCSHAPHNITHTYTLFLYCVLAWPVLRRGASSLRVACTIFAVYCCSRFVV